MVKSIVDTITEFTDRTVELDPIAEEICDKFDELKTLYTKLEIVCENIISAQAEINILFKCMSSKLKPLNADLEEFNKCMSLKQFGENND